MNVWIPTLLAAVAATPAPSPAAHAAQASAFFEAYNSADRARLVAFATANMSSQALKDESSDEFATRLLRRRSQTGALTLRGVDTESETDEVLLASSENGHWFDVDLTIARNGGKLAGVGIDTALPPPQNIAPPHDRASLQSAISTYVHQLGPAGFSGIAYVRDRSGSAFWSSAGYADRSRRSAITPDTQFNISSIGKLFTHVAVLQLVQAGTLHFDDTIGKWLPDYPNAEARTKVTVRQLLDMRSGIGDIFGPRFAAMDHAKLQTLEDYLPLFAADPLEFEPGSDQRYSNGGYVVLGLIVERAAHESYYRYVRSHIFEPAGMTNTGYPLVNDHGANVAVGYTETPNGVAPSDAMQPARGSSAGGAYSTARDLGAFLRALYNGKLVARPYAAELARGNGAFGFAGGSPGFNSIVFGDFSRGDALIVLANVDPTAAVSLGRRIHRWQVEL